MFNTLNQSTIEHVELELSVKTGYENVNVVHTRICFKLKLIYTIITLMLGVDVAVISM